MTEFEIAQIALGLMKYYRRGKGNDYLMPFEHYAALVISVSEFDAMSIKNKIEFLEKGEIEPKIKIPKLSEESVKWLSFDIDELEISLRTSNALKGANIRSIEDLYTYNDLLRIPNLGRVGIKEIKKSMEDRGFSLKNI